MLDKKYIIYLVLAGLCFLAYANSINNGFVSDDVAGIMENPNISHLSGYWFEPQELLNSLSYRMAKFDTVPYHLFSIILHFLNTVLVFFFLRLFFKIGPSALSAAIFAVHPIHTEAVAWISGRPYLISAFFILATYLLYYKETRITYLLSLTIFSYFINKNYSFYAFLPFFIILSDVVFNRWRKNWKLWLPFLLITALRLITAGYQIKQRVAVATLETGRIDGWQNLFSYFVYSIFSHLWLLIWPARLTLYHEPLLFYTWAMWLGFIALCILTCFLPYIFKKAKIIFLGMGMFILFLAPTYSPIPITNTVAERYIYLPSIFLCILIAFFYEAYAQKLDTVKRKLLIAIFIFIITAYGVRTVIRNKDWKDAKTFWQATLRVSPDSSGAHNNGGFIYLKEKNFDKAIEEFKIAIKLNPKRAYSYNNLGVAYKALGKTGEAIALYKEAIALKPDYAQAYNNLANIYQNMGKQEEAIALYKEAIAFYPGFVDALNNLGVAYKNSGKNKEAIALYKKAIDLSPNYAASYKNLAVIYYLEKQYDLSIKYCDRAIALGYENDPIFLKLLKPYRQAHSR